MWTYFVGLVVRVWHAAGFATWSSTLPLLQRVYAVIQQWLRLRKQHRNKPFVTALSGEIKLLRTGVITAVWTVAVFVFFMIRVTSGRQHVSNPTDSQRVAFRENAHFMRPPGDRRRRQFRQKR